MNHSISELMIGAARALRAGAADHMVALALQADGVPQHKTETIIRWCKLLNQRNTHLKTIDDMKAKYPWEDGMGEISGFGGSYETACRDMVYSGLAWLDTRPDADLKATTYKDVIGILNPTSPDAEELEKAVLAGCPDCSGAMHHATMSVCMYVAKNGWNKYVEEMKKRNRE